jgi:TonB family protein
MSDMRDDIEKYLKGELSPQEMHALEKKALSDPFLADALEGGTSIDQKDFFKDIKELHKKTDLRERHFFTPLRIAAGIVIVIGVSLFFVLNPKEQPAEIVQKKKQETPRDSVIVNPDVTAVKPIAKETVKPTILEPEPQTNPAVETEAQHEPTIATLQKNDSIIAPPAITKNSHIIEGTVTVAEDGLPLPGVTVVVKGTTFGTTTDINGKYSIDVPGDQSLVFSYIGMQTGEVSTKDKSMLDIKMVEDVSQLSEVVITRAPLPKRDDEEPVVKLAQPVGGFVAYDKYLEKNRRYPELALANNVKGKVIIGFDVGVNGELGNFEVIRSVGFGCDEEVVRLVKSGPVWNPTTEDDKPVESTIRVKMKFDAAKYKARGK